MHAYHRTGADGKRSRRSQQYPTQTRLLGDSLYKSEAADSTKKTGKNVIAFFASVTVGLRVSPHK